MKLDDSLVLVPHYQKASLASTETIPIHDESLDILHQAQEIPEQRVESAATIEELRGAVHAAANEAVRQAPHVEGEIRTEEQRATERMGSIPERDSNVDKLRWVIDIQLKGINNPQEREGLASIRAQQMSKLEALRKNKRDGVTLEPVQKKEPVERVLQEPESVVDEAEQVKVQLESLLQSIARKAALLEQSIERDQRDTAWHVAQALSHAIADAIGQAEVLMGHNRGNNHLESISKARRQIEDACETVQRWITLEDRTAHLDVATVEADHTSATTEQIERLQEAERRQAVELEWLREEEGKARLLLRDLGTGSTNIEVARKELMGHKLQREQLISDTIKYADTIEEVCVGLRMGVIDQPYRAKDVEQLIASIQAYRISKEEKDFPRITSEQEKFIIRFIAKKDFEAQIHSLIRM